MADRLKSHILFCGFRGEGTVPYTDVNSILSGGPLHHAAHHSEDTLGTLTLRNLTTIMHNGQERFESHDPEMGLFVVRSLKLIDTRTVLPAHNSTGRTYAATTSVEALGSLIHVEPSAYGPQDVPGGVDFDGNSAVYERMQLTIDQYRRKDLEVTAVVRTMSQSMIQQGMK